MYIIVDRYLLQHHRIPDSYRTISYNTILLHTQHDQTLLISKIQNSKSSLTHEIANPLRRKSVNRTRTPQTKKKKNNKPPHTHPVVSSVLPARRLRSPPKESRTGTQNLRVSINRAPGDRQNVDDAFPETSVWRLWKRKKKRPACPTRISAIRMIGYSALGTEAQMSRCAARKKGTSSIHGQKQQHAAVDLLGAHPVFGSQARGGLLLLSGVSGLLAQLDSFYCAEQEWILHRIVFLFWFLRLFSNEYSIFSPKNRKNYRECV